MDVGKIFIASQLQQIIILGLKIPCLEPSFSVVFSNKTII